MKNIKILLFGFLISCTISVQATWGSWFWGKTNQGTAAASDNLLQGQQEDQLHQPDSQSSQQISAAENVEEEADNNGWVVLPNEKGKEKKQEEPQGKSLYSLLSDVKEEGKTLNKMKNLHEEELKKVVDEIKRLSLDKNKTNQSIDFSDEQRKGRSAVYEELIQEKESLKREIEDRIKEDEAVFRKNANEIEKAQERIKDFFKIKIEDNDLENLKFKKASLEEKHKTYQEWEKKYCRYEGFVTGNLNLLSDRKDFDVLDKIKKSDDYVSDAIYFKKQRDYYKGLLELNKPLLEKAEQEEREKKEREQEAQVAAAAIKAKEEADVSSFVANLYKKINQDAVAKRQKEFEFEKRNFDWAWGNSFNKKLKKNKPKKPTIGSRIEESRIKKSRIEALEK